MLRRQYLWHNTLYFVVVVVVIIVVIVVIIIRLSLVTGLFSLVLVLKQRRYPPLKLQVSHCSTFHIMCDVPSIAVFCSESIECFPDMAFTVSLNLLLLFRGSNY
jgi:hypothetical protein